MKRATKIQIICIVVLLIVLWLFTSCKSKTVYVPIESVKTEYKERLRVDSIYKYDSIFQDRYMKGDTAFIIKEKYKYLDKIKIVHDSVFKTDSIPVTVIVEKQLSKWEKVKMDTGGWAIGVASCLLIILVIYIIRRFS